MILQFGSKTMEMGGKYLTELRSSNDIFDDTEALRARMEEDGYLLIRGLHDRMKVYEARLEFLRKLQECGALDENAPMEQGVIGKGQLKLGKVNQENYPRFYDVVNSDRVMRFFDRFLGDEAITYNHKWLRMVGTGGNTGVHYDVVYMGRGTKNLYTMWTPFGDLSMDMGTLALCLGSNRFDKIKETYGKIDVDRDSIDGWFTRDPIEIVDKFGGQWASTNFAAGDAIIFGMYMMHGSFNNTTNRFRISSDTRFQLASEPIDDRWAGAEPKGHDGDYSKVKSIDDARKEWGL